MGTLLTPATGQAQDDSAPTPPKTVLQSGTRLVIEDVLVMNAQGEPVHGLPKSAFHVFDQSQPQMIRNFEEGSSQSARAEAPPPLPPGTFSNNSFLYSSSLVSEVFLIDADALRTEAQMFVLQQLRLSINMLPAGVQAAIFCQTSGHTVQVRGLTANRAELFKGVAECIPRLPTYLTNSFVSGLQELLTVAATLQPIPGRKNILWFSGPFPLVPMVNNDLVKVNTPEYVSQRQAMHLMQNMLSEARISVFPIDPRGVLVQGMPQVAVGNSPEQNRLPSATMSHGSSVSVPARIALSDEYDYMQQMADATGGTAFHLNNLHEEIDQALSLGQNAYTLSYSPARYATDDTWHDIRIAVDGPYRISYRRGYLASWTGPAAGSSGAAGRLLTAESKSGEASLAAGPASNQPLIFTVQVDQPSTMPLARGTASAAPGEPAAAPSVLPGPPPAAKHDLHIRVTVQIPVRQLGFTHDGSRWQSSATVAAYAYDDYGKLKGGEQQQIDSALSEQQWQAAQNSQVATHQTFAMPHAAKYVLFVVTDRATRRQGTLMIPARVLLPLS